MSNQSTSNLNVGLPTFISIVSMILIAVGFFFLPWVTYPDYDLSYTALAVASDVDAKDIDDVDILSPSDWSNQQDSYPADVQPLSVDYNYSANDIDIDGTLIVPQSGAPRAGNTLFVLLIMLGLLLIFVVLEVLRSNIKQETLSYAAWISIIGLFGVFLFIFNWGTHGTQDELIIEELARQMILAEGGMESFGYIDDSDSNAADSDLVQVSSIRDARSNVIQDTTFSNNYRSIYGSLGLGFWTMTLAMVGLSAQIIIPRNLSRMSNFSSRDGSQVSSGMVVSDSTLVRDIWWRQVIIAIAIIFALFPVLFIISSAINPQGTLSTQGIIPRTVDEPSDLIQNFRLLMVDNLEINPFWNWILNSFIVASTTTILAVLVSALSAYSFSRFRFTGRRQLLLGILLIQVFPNLLAMIALFLILFQIGELAEAIPMALPFLSFISWDWLNVFGLNSLGGIILVYLGGAMGINTWLMKGFFDSIPRDIDESALVDGATHWQIFWMLIFPLVRPILAVVGVLSFVGTFNEFVLARIILTDKERWTLMVGLYNFITADFNRDWGQFSAGALVSAVPVVIIYLALQDQIVGGLTAGSVKG